MRKLGRKLDFEKKDKLLFIKSFKNSLHPLFLLDFEKK